MYRVTSDSGGPKEMGSATLTFSRRMPQKVNLPLAQDGRWHNWNGNLTAADGRLQTARERTES